MSSTTIDRIRGINSGLAIKAPCRVATTANITLSGEQTIDGVAVVADDRVLVKNQTTGSQNGVYTAATSAWTRAADFDGARDVVTGTLVSITAGTTNADTFWAVTTTGTITPGTTSITFTQRQGDLGNTSAFIDTLLDDTTAAAARTTLGAAQLTSALTTVTLASGDLIHIADVSDSNAEKKALTSDIPAVVFATTRVYSATITRDMTAASGDVSYTGVGFTPTEIDFIGGLAGVQSQTWGFTTGASANRSINVYPGGSGATVVQGTSAGVIYEDAGKYQGFVLKTFDADGFTLTWTKGSTPAAGTGTVYYKARR